MARVQLDNKDIANITAPTLGPVKSKVVAATYKDSRFGVQISVRTEHGFLPGFLYPFRSTAGVTDPKELKSIQYANARLQNLLLDLGYTKAQVQAVTSGKGLLVLNEAAPVEQDGLDEKQPGDVILSLVGRELWIINATPDVTGDRYGQPIFFGSEKVVKDRWNAVSGPTSPFQAANKIAAAEGLKLGASPRRGASSSATQADDEVQVSGDANGEVVY